MPIELKCLAEEWRSAATRIENKFSAHHQETSKQIVLVLEHCAEQLEEINAKLDKPAGT